MTTVTVRKGEDMMKKAIIGGLLVLGLAVPAYATHGQDLKLSPSSFGPHTVASWRGQEGLQDSSGDADQAFYLQKDTNEEFAAAIGFVSGLFGTPVSEVDGLSWDHRLGDHCSEASPRWSLRLRKPVAPPPPASRFYRANLACAEAISAEPLKTDDQLRVWFDRTFTDAAIAAAVTEAGGNPATDTIQSLIIIHDEGPSGGSGRAHIDNITIQATDHTKVFTSAEDNESSKNK